MKKKLFLLASVVMGAALVGGTFATWAVTDNADPFSIKVSTGKTTTDDTEYVTLSWGEHKDVRSVSNLEPETIRKAGVLDLYGETASDSTLDGTLHLELEGGSHLLAKLHVDVYAGNIAATDGVIDPDDLDGLTPKTFDGSGNCLIQINQNESNLFTVAVYLDASTTTHDLEEMGSEQVKVTFDWGPGSDVLTTNTLYATGFSGAPHAYAWKGSKTNGEYPGVLMTEVAGLAGYYTVEIPADFEGVIFSYNNDAEKSGDIAIASSFTAGKNLFTYDGTSGTAKGTFGTLPEVKTPDYYLIGSEWGDWSAEGTGAIHLTSPVDGAYTVDITNTKENATFKIIDVANDIWYGETSHADGAPDFTLGEIHTYTITFRPAGPTYISCVVKA